MLASPTHVLHKLRWEISQLKKALVSEPEKLAYTHAPAYFAFNCAVTVWHLADWVWEASGSDQRAEILQRFRCGAAQASKSSFQKALMERFRAIHICRQIATGSKLMTVTLHPDPNCRWCMLPRRTIFRLCWRSTTRWSLTRLRFTLEPSTLDERRAWFSSHCNGLSGARRRGCQRRGS